MSPLRVERRDAVTLLTLDLPDRRNAMTAELTSAWADAIADIAADPSVRAVVVTGEGSAFCSGGDLSWIGESPDLTVMAVRERMLPFYRSWLAVRGLGVPVIAAVNGPAIGAGTQLALAADLRTVSGTATFAIPTATLGLAVDPWTIRRLALLAGGGHARRILLACEPVSADEALGCGLADAAGDLDAALERAARIAALAPLTLAYTKQVLNRLQEPDVDDPGLESLFDEVWRSADVAEGQSARRERRPPRFEGR
jgi:enoyl-CoA hydratase